MRQCREFWHCSRRDTSHVWDINEQRKKSPAEHKLLKRELVPPEAGRAGAMPALDLLMDCSSALRNHGPQATCCSLGTSGVLPKHGA